MSKVFIVLPRDAELSFLPICLSTCQALAFILWQFVVNFIFEPTAMQCFNHTLNRLKSDPRITVRLGATDEIRGGIKGKSPERLVWNALSVPAALGRFGFWWCQPYLSGPSAWGSNSQSRVARQQVPHQIYKDASGVEHVRVSQLSAILGKEHVDQDPSSGISFI